MDLVNEKKVHYPSEACANCGCLSSGLSSEANSGDLRLCPSCLNERHSLLGNMREKVRKKFELNRSPVIRSCFLRLLLSRDVDLTPDGWRMGVALGFELKGAGFHLPESRQILLKARANEKLLDRLLDGIYKKRDDGSLTCDQMRAMSVICDQCPEQYLKAHHEHKTDVY